MTKVLIVLILALVVEAVGVVFLSKGLKQIGEVQTISAREIGRIIAKGATNASVLFGVALETAFFAIAAKFFLKEEVSVMRWAGVALIVFGAMLVSYSEKAKSKPAEASPTNEAPVSRSAR
ncbi:MAG: hypothetical protein MUF81_07165 [Verrucomicrobia bacterium]|nr:hypothetical protein [Verrucomicrobiota bacterium]